MWNVKSTMLFIASLVVVIFVSMKMASAEEKTMTQKINEMPTKVGNWFSGEVEKTKEFQKKSFAEAKTKWPWNVIFKGKDNE